MNFDTVRNAALKPVVRSKAASFILGGAVLAGGIVGYLWAKGREIRFVRYGGGMKVGHDPREINLKSRYQDEGEKERDVVDQAVYESFICSDPPAY